MHELLLGGIAVASFVAGLIFLRYWLSTRDRFFLLFTASFWLEGLNRVHMAVTASWNEEALPVHYVVRLISYLLILLAIWLKNRPGRH
ncbi:DUF5985 family protein [Rhizobacter sp. Root404]|uniref:DUF5985 family protein n=1 Tax=Rhizobacter sp. Root404 TaxID=1736528 RepID=UPI0006FDF402|nr:DUF5985 family protein [Rhizobacter sp. Root404]KQW36190.1 hypothetical protein ASC76_15880 [Rhizobacter sp. Root404]